MSEDKQTLAEERTDWAEDRTVLANERTFAAWMRTGVSAVAIGLGFQAIFGKAEPLWLAKAAASGFIGIGIFIFILAQYASARLLKRLNTHAAEPVSGWQLKVISTLFSIASLVLGFLLWWL